MTNSFDVASNTYDITFTYSKVGMAQRQIVYKHLDVVFKTNKTLKILELNCGTGYDALQFAKKGHHVLATDISSRMISVCQNKNKLKNLEFKTLDINAISQTDFSNKFDIIFSNFGGLNCLSSAEIHQFFKNASQLLSDKGKLILVIMPKLCIWERLYFSLKNEFKKAKRRQTNDFIQANVNGVKVKTWYYNPQDLIALSHSTYNINTLKPIGLTVPPSYLEQSFLSSKFCLSLFKFLDSIFTHKRFATYADHFLMELELK
ncbi:class I SAM-dependent methyltransferase [Aurantibacter aestuarii]|uniref:Class I SAM-dependent methyltransferase n=1 Tax=Aurantibacter aestuarii TaxID=1266046 RepID=A0A2T1NDT7_9FLAO|nr:class I SAM-dependent methyltransferase [Aurantibacter aestuarii]PSG90612.1 class I SAM-dependent methyltransferase [Aurantibacter aestuarii]